MKLVNNPLKLIMKKKNYVIKIVFPLLLINFIYGQNEYGFYPNKLYKIETQNNKELSFDHKYANSFKICRYCESKEEEACQNEISFYPREIFKVTAKRAYFYSSPDVNCLISPSLFIVHNDRVIVYSEYEEFYFVMYLKKNGGDISGWMPKKQLTSTGKNIGSNN